MKTTAHISYGKIKAQLHALEQICTKEELHSYTHDLGLYLSIHRLFFLCYNF